MKASSKPAPDSFRDTAGRVWSLKQTVSTLKRVRTVLNIDLMMIDEGEPPLSTRLYTDPMLIAEVVFQCLAPQMETAGISVDDFLLSCDGGSACQMRDAFFAGLTDFFRQWGRPEMADAIDKTIETVNCTCALAQAQLLLDDPNTLATEALEIAQSRRRRRTRPNAGKLSTERPGPLESIPAP
ncbi:MAG: hypothetical protein NT069_23330 [Planctomycetota bacterium]|nr:hypothetical protein [Planctomycetota bacterium]